MKIKIIYLISFSPKYQFLKHTKDSAGMIHYWENPKGEYIGVFDKDWGGKIICKLQELYPGAEYEVWRPDTRADKTYIYESQTGINYCSFPCQTVTNRIGLKYIKEEYSKQITDHLNVYIKNGENPVLIFPFVTKKLFSDIFYSFNNRIPIIVPHLINNQCLFKNYKTLKPISLIHRYIKTLQTERLLRQIKYFTIPHLEGEMILREKYNFKLSFFHPGIDTPNLLLSLPKSDARKVLGISETTILLLVSSRMVVEKQVDKLILVLSKLKRYNWLLHITGHGEPDHISLIKQLIIENELTDRVKLCGYVSDEVLMQYNCAADLYCIPSIMEGGPISALLAIWYGLPVFSTNTGAIAEFLIKTKSGLIVNTINYPEWENVLETFFKDAKVVMPPMPEFEDFFSTNNNIHRLNKLIMESITEYYG